MKRALIDVASDEGPVLGDFYFWSLAELMATAWVFFADVDFVQDPGRPWRGFILAREPRRKLRPSDLASLPKVLREGESG